MTTSIYGRGRPYPVRSMMRARELSVAGLKPKAIRDAMLADGLPTPDLITVKRWVSEEYNEAQRRAARAGRQRATAAQATFRLAGAQRGTPSLAYRAEFIRTLERAGLTADAIPKVCSVVLGELVVDAPKRRGPKLRRDWSSDANARLLAAGLEMRQRGITYPTISAVFEMYHGVQLTPDAARRWLTLHGARRRPKLRRDWSSDANARLLAAGLEMRQRGIAYPMISAVFEMYHGVQLTPDAARRWLTLHGAERNPNKMRPELNA